MGNPAPFHARSRIRNGTGALRRSGAISVSHCHSPNHSHVDCPCCSSTLTSTARYAPYALAARRAFQQRRSRNRRHPPLAPELVQSLSQPQPQSQSQSQSNDNYLDMDLLHLLDNDDHDSHSDSGSQSDSHSDSLSDSDDLDAIPFPYSSASAPTPASPSASSSAFATMPTFSFNQSPSPPPLPRLPSSSEIQRLYANLPTTTTTATPAGTLSAATLSANAAAASERRIARLRSLRASAMFANSFNNNNNNNNNGTPASDTDPEPWMYGTLPRRAAVTVPITPLRPPAEPRLGDQGTHLISPSSGVTAASTSASLSSSAAADELQHQQQLDGRGSLVGNVIRGMYSSLSSLLGSSTPAPTTASTSTATDPELHVLAHNRYMTPLHPTHTRPPTFDMSAPTSTAAASTSTHTPPADLASTSVSSTRPITRARHPRPRPAAPRRPTGLALAPALSARSRGTLANAAAQAHAEHHVTAAAAAAAASAGTPRDPWDFPGVPTYHAFGPGQPSDVVDGHFVRPSAYHRALSAYAYAGGGRGGRIEYPPTPRAFYATVGSVGSSGAGGRDFADLGTWLGQSPQASSYPATAGEWGRAEAEPEDERTPAAWLDERAASLHGVTRDASRTHPDEEERAEDQDEDEEMQMHDDERERALMTYIPESWLHPGAIGGGGGAARDAATSQAELHAGQDDDEDELGPMDDSWEMVVRPFDSARGPATPYDYHEHMF